MQYSKLLFVLPLASAALVRRQEVVEMDYVTDVQTQYVTQYGTVPPAAPTEAPAPAPAPAQPSAQAVPAAGHGHAQFHSHNPADSYQPASTWSAPPPPPASYAAPPPPPPSSYAAPAPPADTAAPAPAPSSAPASAPSSTPDAAAGGSGSGGCPADTSGAHLSPSVDSTGNPTGGAGKSMIDSINYLRRLYNESAACLEWSDTLAEASGNCANQGNENNCCRANSNVISDMQYGSDGVYSDLTSSVFEGSMMLMLCQSPSDPELKGSCGSTKTGEVSYTGQGDATTACTSGACTGHRDAIVDAEGTNHFVGVATNPSSGENGKGYMSCSFSATNDIFA
ncbi:MAG: hypothetical protein Q9162_003024 [Coniocarpon cinnabarinum]